MSLSAKEDVKAGVEAVMEENEQCKEVEMVELQQEDQGRTATENVEQKAKRKTAEDEAEDVAEDEALSKVAKGKQRSQGDEPERRSGVELDNTGAESSKTRDDKRLRAVGEVVEDMTEEEDEAAEHAHKRGRHEQAWRDVESNVEPRRDKSESA